MKKEEEGEVRERERERISGIIMVKFLI